MDEAFDPWEWQSSIVSDWRVFVASLLVSPTSQVTGHREGLGISPEVRALKTMLRANAKINNSLLL